MMTNTKFYLSIVISSVLSALVAVAAYSFLADSDNRSSISDKQNVRFSNFPSLSGLSGGVPDGLNFVTAAEKVTPAVVHIKTYYPQGYSGGNRNQVFEDFFKDFFNAPNGGGRQEEGEEAPSANSLRMSSGSGVIVSEDGYIVTNNHVINDADKIEVVMDDKRRFIASVIGTDPTTDLALLKIEAKELPFVKYGDSDNLKIGEWVLAVGNPFDLTSTVTAGIVSAKARNINILRNRDNFSVESFIQTDAAVNPGNSGGALINLNGELIGINTAIATQTGSYSGYSFAVPVTLVKKVIDDLLQFGEVQRGLLGVSIIDVTAELAEEKGIKDIKGVYVASVNNNSAAQEAGIEAGDVIVAINDTKVNSSSELQELVARNRPGDKVRVTLKRKDKEKTLTAILKSKSGDTQVVKKEPVKLISVPQLGAKVCEIGESEKDKYGIKNGVKVAKIEDGKLRAARVKEGFVITHVDKESVSSVEQLTKLLANKKGGVLLEGVEADGEKAFYGIGF